MAKAEQRFGQGRDGSDQNFDYMFKLLIIGNSSVGKTSFLFRYADDTFSNSFVSTVGIDFKVKTVYRHDKRVKLQIWDTAGQERYRTITTAYYRGAMGFILMYDITNEDSFNAVQDWATQVKTYSWDNAQVIMVGNKCDLDEERVVPPEKGRHLAEQLGFEYYEVSAKENINVQQVFERLVDIICVKMSERVDVEAPAAPATAPPDSPTSPPSSPRRQERYRTITTAYYRGAMGFILMYDITNEDSFNAVQDWATQVKTYSWDNAQVIMVGNKCDLDEERVVPPEKGRHLAEQLGFEYYEVSAKENINVQQVFERLVDIICVKMSERVDVEAPAAPGNSTARLSDKPAQLPQKCC
ncbi:hypothetical protein CRUP_030686 [Coryphaenoides rupestris]|nr:hypothetical protein CRUP_030686 [Coryphaenoides rupestris]